MSDLNSKVNTSDVLSLEEIQDSNDLTNKVASASALLSSKPISYFDTDVTTDGYGRALLNESLDRLEPIGARIIPDRTKDVYEGIVLINLNWQGSIYLTLLSWKYELQTNKSFRARVFVIDKFE